MGKTEYFVVGLVKEMIFHFTGGLCGRISGYPHGSFTVCMEIKNKTFKYKANVSASYTRHTF
jgi:hypothetical protein